MQHRGSRYGFARCVWVSLMLLGSVNAAWADAMMGPLTMSVTEGGAKQDVFAPDTPKIFVRAVLTAAATKSFALSCVWVAEDTNGAAPANYKIASVDLKATQGDKIIDCNLSKPTSGWPVGSYRVDVDVEGKTITSAKFKVAPPS